jgi:hypothetical protein
MIKTVAVRAAIGMAMMLGLAAPALAEAQTILVEVDESRIMEMPAAPGAIVIGNPSIADVSIQGRKLFIHGRGYGQTNLTILDLDGNQIGNFSLIGTHNQPSSIAVFRGPERYSYSCANFCEAQVQVGDNGGFMSETASQLGKKMGLATNSKVDEAAAPAAAPQQPQ